MGISKSELLNEYYFDELPVIIESWSILKGGVGDVVAVDGMEFFEL